MTSAEAIPTPQSGLPRSAAAYEEVLVEILAIPEESLPPILIDIPTAVTTVLGVLPRIRELRPEMVETLRKFDFGEFDKLEEYTLAVSHAHAVHRAAHGPKLSVAALGRELVEVRAMLLSDVRSLASHGLVSGERLGGCRGTPGYRALAYDVLMLVEVIRAAWERVQGCTPVTLHELDRAAASAERLLTAVGLKDQAVPTVAEATVIRRKAFAAFVRVYGRARAVVLYLRAEIGDGDEIAPSLYAGRGKTRKGRTDGDEPGAGEGSLGPAEPGKGDGGTAGTAAGDEVPVLRGTGSARAAQGTDSRVTSSAGNEASGGSVAVLGTLLNGATDGEGLSAQKTKERGNRTALLPAGTAARNR